MTVINTPEWDSTLNQTNAVTVSQSRDLALPAEHLLPRNDVAYCLPVLLRALGWQGDTRHLTEALPYFGGPLDVSSTRQVMVNLGFASRLRQGSPARLRSDELPSLFLPERGPAVVVLDTPGRRRVTLFDPEHPEGLREDVSVRALGKGQIMAFQPLSHPETAGAQEHSPSWLATIMRRFRPHLFLLLFISLLVMCMVVASPLYVMTVYDRVVTSGSVATLLTLLVGMGIAVGGEFILRTQRARLLSHVGARMDVLVGRAMFQRLLGLNPQMSEGSTVGAQVSRMKDFETVREFLTGPASATLLDLPFTLVVMGVIFAMGGWLGLVPLVAATILLAMGFFARTPLRRRVNAMARATSNRQELAIESVTQHRLLRTCGAVDHWLRRYRVRTATAAQANLRTAQLTALLGSMAQLITMVAGLTTVVAGSRLVMTGDLSTGGLIASMILVWRALTPYQAALMVVARSEQVRSSIRQIDRLMEVAPEQPDGQSVRPVRELRGAVNVARVSLRYAPDAEPALLGVSADIQPGEMVAVIGHNGAGKTSLIKVIAGMVRPQTGLVKVDGMDIRRFDPVEFRREIGYMPEDPQILRGTVIQNILLADPTADEEAVRAAAEEAGITEEDVELPKGLETRFGDQRAASPSLRTRIGLARVMLRRPRLVLLDEPTGGLDSDGDTALVNVLKTLKSHSTVFVITHRPSYMRLADKVLELRQGQVSRFGVPQSPAPKAAPAPEGGDDKPKALPAQDGGTERAPKGND